MNIKAIVIDDEDKSRQSLRLLLEKYCEAVSVVGIANSVAEGVKLIEKETPDVVFLDVIMPNETGFGIFEKFELINFHIVFTTGHEEYAIKAIKHNAFDYLLKPIAVDDLQNCINKIVLHKEKNEGKDSKKNIPNIQFNNNKRIAIPDATGLRFVDINNIIKLVADKNYTTIQLTNNEKYVVAKPLRDYETLLSQTNFMRVHDSYIVNLQLVSSYRKGEGGFLTMCDNSEVEVSRRRKQELITRLSIISL